MGKKYADYNHEEIFDKEVLGEVSQEEQIEILKREKKQVGYVVKTTVSGKYMESEILPYYTRKKDIPRINKDKPSSKAQKNLNDRNSVRNMIRTVHCNFVDGDLILTLTYKDHYLPDEQQVRKDIKNYINRLKRYRKKHELPELKYIYVVDFVAEEDRTKTKKVRIHLHMIINYMDRDAAEELWGMGRAESKKLKPDEYGFEGIVRYMFNQGKGKKRWVPSRNLSKPKVFKSFTKLTKSKAGQLYINAVEWEETFEKLYKGKYKYTDGKRYESDLAGGFYIYCQMRRRD